MTDRSLHLVFVAICLAVGACSVFGTPKVTPCGICEPITILGKTYEICGKPAELARLKANLKAPPP